MYVYILTNQSHRTLYIGVTSNLAARIFAHREGRGSKFAAKYKLNKLIYVEKTVSPIEAIQREKQLKGWKRSKKEALIEKANPDWLDLFERING